MSDKTVLRLVQFLALAVVSFSGFYFGAVLNRQYGTPQPRWTGDEQIVATVRKEIAQSIRKEIEAIARPVVRQPGRIDDQQIAENVSKEIAQSIRKEIEAIARPVSKEIAQSIRKELEAIARPVSKEIAQSIRKEPEATSRASSDDAAYWGAFRRFTNSLRRLKNKTGHAIENKDVQFECVIQKYGRGFGQHELCSSVLKRTLKETERFTCYFLSYGIHHDYSFDTALGTLGCKGFGFDPTVQHPFHLTTNVTFLPIGAPMIHDSNKWHSVSPVQIANTFGLRRIGVLKMDCEGCEYAIASSILDCQGQEPSCDRHFFDKVDQFAVEVHTYKKFVPTHEHRLGLAKLFWLLEESGLVLMYGTESRCGPFDFGCVEEFVALGLNCLGCKNFLFARSPDTLHNLRNKRGNLSGLGGQF